MPHVWFLICFALVVKKACLLIACVLEDIQDCDQGTGYQILVTSARPTASTLRSMPIAFNALLPHGWSIVDKQAYKGGHAQKAVVHADSVFTDWGGSQVPLSIGYGGLANIQSTVL